MQRSHLKPFIFQCLALFICFLTANSARAEYNPIKRLSVSNSSVQANQPSFSPKISGDPTGRYVVFSSSADNLVSGDTNQVSDIFIFDRFNSKIFKVSNGNGKVLSNGDSLKPTLSDTGRYIVFESAANNLVENDTNNSKDIFLYDLVAKNNTRISVSSSKTQANGDSSNAMISADGLFIVYQSDADNLVNNDNNSATDIFLYNVSTTTTTRISIKTDSTEADAQSTNPKISGDGRYIVFQSLAENLINSDSNSESDIFLRDTFANTTSRVSVSSTTTELNGPSYDPTISADSSKIAFVSEADNAVANDTNDLADIFTYKRVGAEVVRVSIASNKTQANAASSSPDLNSDGSYISFSSNASNLIDADINNKSDIFLFDSVNEKTFLISVDALGNPADNFSDSSSNNTNGHFLAFTSVAENLVDSDINDVQDIFVIDTQCLVSPPGVTPGDFDADGTNDCDDKCALDAAKTTPGVCGCGIAETDTDGDGTPNCNDSCPSDSNKTTPGDCGCGLSDADSNNNGVADCLDPDQNTKPERPRISLRKNNQLRVIVGLNFTNQVVQVQLKRKKRILATKKTRNRSVQFKALSGSGKARYRYLLPEGGFSKWSRPRKFNFR